MRRELLPTEQYGFKDKYSAELQQFVEDHEIHSRSNNNLEEDYRNCFS